MIYRQFDPHPVLANYIDAYWQVSGLERGIREEKILPDGCIDLIFNLGADCRTDNGNFTMQHEKTYLVGTMTGFKNVMMSPETRLLGIRFKPGAFSFFFTFSSLHEVRDITIEFERRLAPAFPPATQNFIEYLDHYFLKILSKPKHDLLPVVADIQNQNGLMHVKTLAQQHCITIRHLERLFKQQIGIGPKELGNLFRYQMAHRIIQNNVFKRSLLDIAFECGYYDHSHLTSDFKRYTGLAPSQL